MADAAAQATPTAPAPRPTNTVPPSQPPAGSAPTWPYRFLGTVAAAEGGTGAIVLFGRGRVVTLAEPGPLDDEYVVEAWGDEQVLVRHLRSGIGRFLRLELRAPAAAR